jgi:hypothetical protein
MIQCKQRLILLGFDTAHQHHCQVVEQQPVVLQINGEHGVKGSASRMAYDYESQVRPSATKAFPSNVLVRSAIEINRPLLLRCGNFGFRPICDIGCALRQWF